MYGAHDTYRFKLSVKMGPQTTLDLKSGFLTESFKQATGPPRSGAGVGVGMLRSAGDFLTWKLKTLERHFTNFSF